MKPQLLKVSKDVVDSFSARQDTMPDVNNHWHYHPEIELVYFKKGKGTQFIGDSISPFLTGDIVMIGSNLPHYWQFDDSFIQKQPGMTTDVNVVHFNENFWGDLFLNLPENKSIRTTLERSKRGLHIRMPFSENIGCRIEKIITAEGSRKIILLMEVLIAICECRECSLLASISFQNNFQESEKDRINAIYNYSIANFKKQITLEEIAKIANISPNSFCKFFKSRSRKTYSQFMNEIRIGQACKLLIDNKLNIKEICNESGFNNFSSFHKHFKQIKGKTPLNYQKSFFGSDN